MRCHSHPELKHKKSHSVQKKKKIRKKGDKNLATLQLAWVRYRAIDTPGTTVKTWTLIWLK